MGVLDRLSRLVRSNINDLIARAENPEKMLNQIIEDMRRQYAQAKQEVASAIADERKLHNSLKKARKGAGEWEARARLAVRSGRDDLAKQALLRVEEHAREAQGFEQQWLHHNGETTKLKDSLRQLNDKIEEAKRKKNLLIARQRRAEAQRRIQQTMQGIGEGSAFRAFDQLAERIEDTESRALAEVEVTEELSGDRLARQFDALEAGGAAEVDDKLLALKESMGLLTGGGPEGEVMALGAGTDSSAGAGDDPVVVDAELEKTGSEEGE